MTMVVGSLLGGCQQAVSGAAGVSPADQATADKRAEQRSAVDEALKELASAPMATYHSTLNGTDLIVRVTKGGTMQGSLPVDGQRVQLVDIDNQFYIKASATYWKAHGSAAADRLAKGWARADATDLALDPGAALTPSAAAEKLRKAVSETDQFADPVRSKLPDGTEVFDIGGKLKVTTTQPFRVVAFSPALLDSLAGKKFGDELRLDPATAETVSKFHHDLEAAIGALGKPADAVAQVRVNVTDNKLECSGGSGSCKSTVKVRNSLVGDSKASTVHIVMKSVVSAPGLGKKTCTAPYSAAPNTTSSIACTVKFSVPNRTAQYKVISMPSATADLIATVDVKGLKQKLQQEFTALGG